MESHSSASVDSISHDLKDQKLENNNNIKNNDFDSENDGINNRIKLKLEELMWDHSFVRELPGDPKTDSVPREVLHACYTRVSPSVEVENPQPVAWSNSVAKLLGLDSKEFERPDFPLIFSGALPLVGANPFAQCYGGHQIGMFLNSKSERWEMQLKGAGKTPYSRFADSLAVLRSSIREFLCSEAMHCLGIPTTRAPCLVTTGKYVTRDMFYDGNPKDEPGAIVCRVGQSFLWFAWAVGVAERTASLVAQWQGVGFTHGVLNTDNLSVLGLTIDYGPFGFLDAFDPSYTPNTTDLPGRRYCFANQPDIGLWNVEQFITTLSAAE